jgi:outer membrane lipoprotein LolB
MIPRLVALAAVALLGACVTQPPGKAPLPSDGLSLEQRRTELEALPGWEMRGRLAVETSDGAYQGRFQWRQEAGRLLFSVRGPLGVGGVEVSGSDDALIVRADGESYALDDPEAQLSALVGWWLPISSLDDWLLGLPDRRFAADAQAEAGGLLLSLQQRLWQLDYDRHERSGPWLLPRRIEMNHDQLRLRLIVDAWRPVTERDERLN